MITAKHKDMKKRKYWTAEEEEQLIELYDKYCDENDVFLAYKVKKSELIGGRSISSHTAKLRSDWNIKSVGSSRMVAHKIDYKALYEAHESGCTMRQIAKDFKLSHQSARVAIEKYKRVNGIKTPMRQTGWSKKEDEALLKFVSENTKWNGDVKWVNMKERDVLPGRTHIAMVKRWTKNLKADFEWNGQKWVKDTPSSPNVSSTKVKTTRRTFLWGAFTIESIEA